MTTTLTGDGVQFAYLVGLRGAVRLERMGLRRSRGSTATSIAKRELGITGNRDKVLAALDAEIERMLEERRERI